MPQSGVLGALWYSFGMNEEVLMAATVRQVGSKVVSLADFLVIVEALRNEKKRIVQCDGVFDLVHPGHIEYFSRAKEYGDILYVVVVTDTHVKKGTGRPLFSHDIRSLWVASLTSVDYVVVNDEPGPHNILEAVRPDVLVKGAEYEVTPTEGFLKNRCLVESYGGRVAFVKEIAHSSHILQKIYSLFA